MYRMTCGLALALIGLLLLSCGEDLSEDNPLYKGQTDFTNSEPGSMGYGQKGGLEGGGFNSGATSSDGSSAPAPGSAPQGRVGDVEEADIYKVDNDLLFYLNTYRGFLIYDMKDPKNPKRISKLPVYGYPIEMFVKNNTVYALIKDALYLTQEKGKLQFKKHNVSQLVAIDISDIKNPKVLQTVDITGQLREGVSRKIDDTIYVVSYQSRYYYYGWNYNKAQQDKEQAWVYSFNVADPKNLKLVDQLKIFEGGGFSSSGPQHSESKYFQKVTISATANALMVVENWRVRGYVRNGPSNCSSYTSLQQAKVSIIDISDTKGKIHLHTKFETYGQLGDQFKQTYIYDDKTKKGTYLGIFARREWSSSNCSGSSLIRNTIESWDVTDGKNPKRQDEIPFGKPNETVRGSVFDRDRRVAFAITARAMDPLYAISFTDPAKLAILDEIDGLSGDMNVFRFIEEKKFLIGIGRDNSSACTGYGSATTGWSTKVAVSIIDVQNLSDIKLVQRKCVAVNDVKWTSSDINWNLDQAHKMIGMHSDGKANVITVPVYYWKRNNTAGWWYSHYETAVGMMTWDISKYDPTKSEKDQDVLNNFGTIIHPKGKVKRSVVYTANNKRRMMVNLSTTHVSLVDIDDLTHPVSQSVVEVAPYHAELYRFGQYMVEHIRPGTYYYSSYSSANQQASTFRIKKLTAGKSLEETPVEKELVIGQVERAVPFKNNLLLFRRTQVEVPGKNGMVKTYQAEVMIYDMSNPQAPKELGTVKLPGMLMPYYRYFCGPSWFWGGYWFDYYYGNYGNYGSNSWVATDNGIAFMGYIYNYVTRESTRKLVFLDLSNTAKPAVKEFSLTSSNSWAFFGLISDPSDTKGFYLTYRTKVGTKSIGGATFNMYKYYAQRWQHGATGWKAGASINLPGRLMKTWKQGASRVFLTHDFTYKVHEVNNYPRWKYTYRINLLREIKPYGQPLAELLDMQSFNNFYLKDLVVDSGRLFVNARPSYDYISTKNLSWSEVSDHLMIFDMSKLTLNKKYSQPTATSQVQMMGLHKGKLFLSLPGDGVLVVDADDPSKPSGQQFMRTLGYATHIEFAGDTAYIPSGYFGIYEMNLKGSTTIPYL